MIKNVFRKSLVIGIIILFIGAGVIPSISGNVIKNENFVENTNEKNNSEKATHTVLGEFVAFTYGSYNVYAHEALKNIYEGDWHPFYYVSLVYHENKHAKYRALNEYNIWGAPTLFFDGGFRVNMGAGSAPAAQEAYNLSIIDCVERTVYDIDIVLDVLWLGNAQMDIDVTVFNNEGSTYDGYIRVYVTEIFSTMGWDDEDDNPFTFAFLDYAYNESISVSSGGTWQSSTVWDGHEHNDGFGNDFGSITIDNIMVIAAVFNDEWHQGYARPPDQNPFDAYYVDETVATTPIISYPPEKPIIDGPTIGTDGVEYEYTLQTTDPDDEDVYYYVEWGDETNSGWIGPYPSGEEVTFKHTWTLLGDYEIRAKAKDINDVESVWSDVYPMAIVENEPPSTPEIDGSSSGKIGTLYTYKFTSTDPDNNDVYYCIDWDDGTPEEIVGPFQSGLEGTAKHRWTSQGTYTIRAKAKDIFSEESNWAEFDVTITKTRVVNIPFLNFLQNQPILFQLLQKLLQRLGLQ